MIDDVRAAASAQGAGSLRSRLTLMLGGAVLLAALAAALLSFVLAYGEAREFQDDTLRQIALLPGQTSPAGSRPGATGEQLADPESRIRVIHLPGDPYPVWMAGPLAAYPPGFHTLDTAGGKLRVFLYHAGQGGAIIVAQPTDTRDELALNSALRSLAPLLLLLPVMAWLIARIVRSGLLPVNRLAAQLDAQSAEQPHPLSAQGLAEELVPFVQAINRLLSRIAVLLGQQQRFIADAAHELRTPLAALFLQAQNLQQAGSLAEIRKRIKPLLAGIERTSRLNEQLLNLARVQADASETAIVDVSALARELIAEFIPQAEASGIDLGLDEESALKISAYPDNLRLLLRNGLENAIKHTGQGGEVTVRLRRTGHEAVIEVIDNGPGIPEGERERVLAPFYRMPGAVGGGSGLGLTIAREAAARLGGELRLLTADKGAGTIFSYRHPRRK